MVDFIHDPEDSMENINATLKDFIQNGIIILPDELISLCPSLSNLVDQVFVNPLIDDKMIWKGTDNTMLSFLKTCKVGVVNLLFMLGGGMFGK